MNKFQKLTLTVLLGATAAAVCAADKDLSDPKATLGPNYETATVVEIKGAVVAIRVVDKNQALEGLHLMVQSGSENLDVYVGPNEFVKTCDVTFAKGDKIEIIGSAVKFEGSGVVLARQISRGRITLILRDKGGAPFWTYFMKAPRG